MLNKIVLKIGFVCLYTVKVVSFGFELRVIQSERSYQARVGERQISAPQNQSQLG